MTCSVLSSASVVVVLAAVLLAPWLWFLCLRWFWYALSSDDGWMDGRLHSSSLLDFGFEIEK
jgi:hypothetical protein